MQCHQSFAEFKGLLKKISLPTTFQRLTRIILHIHHRLKATTDKCRKDVLSVLYSWYLEGLKLQNIYTWWQQHPFSNKNVFSILLCESIFPVTGLHCGCVKSIVRFLSHSHQLGRSVCDIHHSPSCNIHKICLLWLMITDKPSSEQK